jgi:hypothetical protein
MFQGSGAEACRNHPVTLITSKKTSKITAMRGIDYEKAI